MGLSDFLHLAVKPERFNDPQSIGSAVHPSDRSGRLNSLVTGGGGEDTGLCLHPVHLCCCRLVDEG